jgi:hypothetical protein
MANLQYLAHRLPGVLRSYRREAQLSDTDRRLATLRRVGAST